MPDLDPAQIRRGWMNGMNAQDELSEAMREIPAAKGNNLEDLQATLTDAGADMDGVLDVANGLLAAFGSNIEDCIAEWDRTDGRSDGEFKELRQ